MLVYSLSLSFSKKNNRNCQPKTRSIHTWILLHCRLELSHYENKTFFFAHIQKHNSPAIHAFIDEAYGNIHKFDNILHQNVLFSAGSQNATLSLQKKESRVHLSTAHTHIHWDQKLHTNTSGSSIRFCSAHFFNLQTHTHTQNSLHYQNCLYTYLSYLTVLSICSIQ